MALRLIEFAPTCLELIEAELLLAETTAPILNVLQGHFVNVICV